MGHQAIIYGRIQEDWQGTSVRCSTVPVYNRAILDRLPDSDDRWPFLTRHMFAAPAHPFGGLPDRGSYRGTVIHFGASTKDDPDDPGWYLRFLAKFEGAVLSKLLWRTARVHFETAFGTERTVLYRVDPDSLGPVYCELNEFNFGEMPLSEPRWTRRESSGSEGRPDWLY